MKKLLLLTTAIAAFSGAFAKKVKFQVDMTGQTVSANGVHIAGNFQAAAGAPGDWDPGTTTLSNGGSGSIYSIIVDIPAGRHYEFKFINGNTWGDAENIPALNQVGHPLNGGSNSNRWFYIDSVANDTTNIPAILFGGTAPSGKFAVRFAVDMQKEAAVSADGVHIAGTLQAAAGAPGDWAPGSLGLVNLFSNNQVYEWIAYLPAGNYEFKYVNGNAWGKDESVPSSCATNNNRTVAVSADVALSKVCYASCIACPVAPPPRYQASFIIDMTNTNCDGGFDSVTVAGSRPELTSWGSGVKLMQMGATGFYVGVIEMDSGEAKFKFRYHKNGSTSWEGGGDRIWNLSADDTMDVTCFGSRDIGPCPSKPANQNITFVVDLSNETPDAQGRIYVMGTFQTPNWQGGALRMSPVAGKLGFYSVTVPGVCPGKFSYKFVNGDSSQVANEENFSDTTQRACVEPSGVGGWNRTYTRISSNDVTIGYVFNSCEAADLSGVRDIAGLLNNVKLYPNPTLSSVNVEFNDAAKSHNIVVTDIAGKTIATYQHVTDNRFTIEKVDLGTGMFFVNITNNRGEVKTLKLIVQ